MKPFVVLLFCLGLCNACTPTKKNTFGKLMFSVPWAVCSKLEDKDVLGSLKKLTDKLQFSDQLDKYTFIQEATDAGERIDDLKDKLPKTLLGHLQVDKSSTLRELSAALNESIQQANQGQQAHDTFDALKALQDVVENQENFLDMTIGEFLKACKSELLRKLFSQRLRKGLENDVHTLIGDLSCLTDTQLDGNQIFEVRRLAVPLLCSLFDSFGNPWENIMELKDKIFSELLENIMSELSSQVTRKRRRRATDFTKREWLRKLLNEFDDMDRRQAGQTGGASTPSTPSTASATTTLPPPPPSMAANQGSGLTMRETIENQISRARYLDHLFDVLEHVIGLLWYKEEDAEFVGYLWKMFGDVLRHIFTVMFDPGQMLTQGVKRSFKLPITWERNH